MASSRGWLLALFGLAGLTAALAAVDRWAPESSADFADRREIERQALLDARALGYRVDRGRAPGLTAGPRAYLTGTDVAVLYENVSDPSARKRLLAAVPPVRLGVRFWGAIGPDDAPGALLLEYGPDGRLLAASFGWDGLVQVGLQPHAGPDFAHRVATKLLGVPAPEPEVVRMGGGIEYVYRRGPETPGAYVYLGGSARWIASLQPHPYPLLTRQFTFFQQNVAFQITTYLMVALVILTIASLLWRLSKRRAGFGHTRLLCTLLALSVLPALAHLPTGLTMLNFITMYLVAGALILLAWSVAEAELRETSPGSIEHWDRLVCRRPLRSTGTSLLIGLGFGAGLSGLLAVSGRLATLFGGGYSGLLLILPEYWLLPSPLAWGLALAAGLAFLVGFGRRVGGPAGAIAGAGVGGILWSLAIPAAPLWFAVAVGVIISLAAGWLMSEHGLVALTAACVTAVSLPTAIILMPTLPLRWGTLLVASSPAALGVLAIALRRSAPLRGSLAAVKPTYVSELEHEARLAGEVEILREFQLSLLPRGQAPKAEHADVAWRMIPADTVGGDFLDLIEDGSGRLWLAIADAAGHGISCSVLTAFTKAAVAEHVGEGVTPAAAMAGIRRLFGRLRTRRSMVTLLLAVWDPKTHQLTVANAGHPPLLIRNGDICEAGRASSPLGTALNGQQDAALEDVVELAPGSVIVAYTDGAPEACSPAGETFGYDRWAQRLEQSRPQDTAGELLDRLLHDITKHRAGRPAEDDLTAVVLKLR